MAGSVEAALAWAAGIDDEVFVAGGAQVYAAALPVTDALVMTWVDAEPEGDTYFPEVDWDDWREVSREDNEGWTLAAYERAAEKKFGKSVTPRPSGDDRPVRCPVTARTPERTVTGLFHS